MTTDLQDIEFPDCRLFSGVEEVSVRQFLASGFRFSYNAGTPIVVNDDIGETFFIILSGLAKITLVNGKKEEVNVTLLRAGDFFGELSLLQQDPVRTANVIAATEVNVTAVQKQEFLELLKKYPEIALNIAREMGGRLRNMNERLVTLTLPPFNRVASTMLHLAQQGRAFSQEGPILLPALPLAEWALFCNVDRGIFMEAIEKLKEMDVLDWQSQRIALKDLDALVKLARPPESSETPSG